MPHRSSSRSLTFKKHIAGLMGSAFALVSMVGISAPASAESGSADPALEAAIGSIVDDYLAANGIPGVTIAASRDGKIVMNKAYGVRSVDSQQLMRTYHRTRMGSLSKMLTAMTFMKYMHDTRNPGLLDQNVYGFNGILSTQDYQAFSVAMQAGWERQTPVVATVISKYDDKVYTYYDDRTYSVGTTSDLDAYEDRKLFYLPDDDLQAGDIQGMADINGNVLTWYRNGRVSYGNYRILGAGFYREDLVDLPPGQDMQALVGIGSSASGKIYSWWEDGTRAVGDYWDLDADSDGTFYSVAPGQNPYTIRSMAISKSDKIYTFYTDETVTRGMSTDLDRYRSAYATSLADGISSQPWPAWFGTITPRHVLSHSAGFEKDIDLTTATAMIQNQLASQGYNSTLGMENFHEYGLTSGRMLYSPGSDNEYSNHGGALAAFLLEELSGMPYKDLLDATLLDPMGIQMGLAWEPLTFLDAYPHSDNNKNDDDLPPDVVVDTSALSFNFREASGYLTSTAIDYLRLMMAMDEISAEERKMLDDATIAMMETAGPGGGFGMGWRIRDTGDWFDHGGSLRGGGAAVSRFKKNFVFEEIVMDDVTVVVMGNLDTPVRDLSQLIAKIISLANIDPDYDLY